MAQPTNSKKQPMTAEMKKAKRKAFRTGLKLKLSLFRIWFFKNIILWIEIALAICFICMMTGNIPADAPILGDLFGPLLEAINNGLSDIDGWMNFVAALASVLFSVGLLTLRLKPISQADIKSKKLKLALIRANLYFNEDGRLVKKTEEMTGTDLDGDGVVSNGGRPKNFFSRCINAIRDFFTIAKADFSGTEEEQLSQYADILSETNMETTEENINEIKEILDDGMDNMKKETIETAGEELTRKEKLQLKKAEREAKKAAEEAPAAPAEKTEAPATKTGSDLASRVSSFFD